MSIEKEEVKKETNGAAKEETKEKKTTQRATQPRKTQVKADASKSELKSDPETEKNKNEKKATEIKKFKKKESEKEKDAAEIAALKDQMLRQAAEYDNYRKRTAKERIELVPQITAGNVEKFLPALDNIERALKAECSDPNYKKGIEMVYDSLVSAFKSLGVEEIIQEDFDPNVHQAVQQVEHAELKSGKVAEVFQKGYKIGNKVIRFALVAIVK